jgi:hypothetical protein
MNSDVKMAFIKEVLSRKGEEMRNAIIQSITREGLSNPAMGITGKASDKHYSMTIPIIRRFQDMGAPLLKNRLVAENVLTGNKPMLKGKKFAVYNRNVWGFYNSIARELMYGLTDEVVESIRKQLNK